MTDKQEIKSYRINHTVIGCQLDDTVVVATKQFSGPFSIGNFGSNAAKQTIMPIAGTYHSLAIQHNNAQATIVQTVSLHVEGNITALTVDIPLGVSGPTQSDPSLRVHVAAQRNISIGFDSPTTSTAAVIRSWTIVFEPD